TRRADRRPSRATPGPESGGLGQSGTWSFPSLGGSQHGYAPESERRRTTGREQRLLNRRGVIGRRASSAQGDGCSAPPPSGGRSGDVAGQCRAQLAPAGHAEFRVCPLEVVVDGPDRQEQLGGD